MLTVVHRCKGTRLGAGKNGDGRGEVQEVMVSILGTHPLWVMEMAISSSLGTQHILNRRIKNPKQRL